jgi:hypothetical protein
VTPGHVQTVHCLAALTSARCLLSDGYTIVSDNTGPAGLNPSSDTSRAHALLSDSRSCWPRHGSRIVELEYLTDIRTFLVGVFAQTCVSSGSRPTPHASNAICQPFRLQGLKAFRAIFCPEWTHSTSKHGYNPFRPIFIAVRSTLFGHIRPWSLPPFYKAL